MEQEKKQAVALMRYLAIAPLITGTQEDYESLLTGNPVLMLWCPPDGLTVA